ncbi:MAG: type II toxin-antitoxin system MqsA family antitoxin, partial [Gallionella sp.]
MNPITSCPLCGGNKSFGTTTFTVDLGFGVVVVRHVPAQLCELCGEDWIADNVAAQLEAIVEQARISHAIVEVA